MKKESLAILCDPQTRDPLEIIQEPGENQQHQDVLLNRKNGARYPLKDGVPSFLVENEIVGSNKKYKDLYDRIARGYDTTEVIGGFLMYGGRDKIRREILKDVQVDDGDKFLEVSIGTGTNLKYLSPNAEFFGLDISMEMLWQCQRNLKKWQREVELFHGTAEALPFIDEVFDVVFHFGGINFFNDKAAAIREMIRVARPGIWIYIGDETEDLARDYANTPMPFAREFYGERSESIVDPIGLVPPEMLDVKSETIWNGKFYMLSFTKPS